MPLDPVLVWPSVKAGEDLQPKQHQLFNGSLQGTKDDWWDKTPTLDLLTPAATLVPAFNAIRGYVAANGAGMTRDETILEELTNLLHAKIVDERAAEAGRPLQFYALRGESSSQVAGRLRRILRQARHPGDGQRDANIELDDDCCLYAVQQLHQLRVVGARRDVIGEAYETLIFPALRGGQGQFFTPRNVATCMAEMLEVSPGERVIDPASGTAGFLIEVSASVERRYSGGAKTLELVGVDKDHLLARLGQDNLDFRHQGGTVVCANSLLPAGDQSPEVARLLTFDSYDKVITNPPFGSRIPVQGPLLRQFDLARVWEGKRNPSRWVPTDRMRDSAAPQVLFIERCWDLLKEGGRCAIVLPEGIAGNHSHGYIRHWLAERADILAVVDCPLETFMPSTSTKTVIIVFEKRKQPRRPPIFMAVAEQCGHDRRGKPQTDANGLPLDDFPAVSAAFIRRQGADTVAS